MRLLSKFTRCSTMGLDLGQPGGDILRRILGIDFEIMHLILCQMRWTARSTLHHIVPHHAIAYDTMPPYHMLILADNMRFRRVLCGFPWYLHACSVRASCMDLAGFHTCCMPITFTQHAFNNLVFGSVSSYAQALNYLYACNPRRGLCSLWHRDSKRVPICDIFGKCKFPACMRQFISYM